MYSFEMKIGTRVYHSVLAFGQGVVVGTKDVFVKGKYPQRRQYSKWYIVKWNHGETIEKPRNLRKTPKEGEV